MASLLCPCPYLRLQCFLPEPTISCALVSALCKGGLLCSSWRGVDREARAPGPPEFFEEAS